MSILFVPAYDETPYPTLGYQVADWIEANLAFGPGDLRGQPAKVDPEKRALLARAYEVYPKGGPNAGRRRFRRVAISVRKGWAKTEFAAWVSAAELHPDAPVRTVDWEGDQPIGGGVVDPYIPLCAYTEEQSDELAYGALRVILQYSRCADDFDIGLARIIRRGGDGKAVSLATAPDSRDGARTTFAVCDEALALDTPLPTPTGWTTMGDIQPGELLLGSDGRPCKVLGKSDIHPSRQCYRVTFRDGTSIIADADHLWYAYRRGGCGHGQGCRCSTVQGWNVRRTTEMLDTEFATGQGIAHTYSVPLTASLDLEAAELPVDPYLLGVWLGDGDERNATISGAADDLRVIAAEIEAAGYQVSWCQTKPGRCSLIYVTTPDSRCGTFGDSVVGRLRKAGLLQNKHLPMSYLRASQSQRLALLQGLMDTDGHATPQGWCAFVTSRVEFATQVAELVRTLGYRATIHKQPDPRSRTGEMVKVTFQAQPDKVPFRLPRKVERCQRNPSRHRWQPITAIDPIASVPVQCVAVDSADHLYLAGEGFVPTHNTHRWNLPRLVQAHRTMLANLPKRRIADAWQLEITTAPAPGEGSVAENTMEYARKVADGSASDARLFFFHRQASDGHDLTTREGIRAAVVEASGPAAEWSDIDGICEQWDDPTADRSYLERVWLNRLVRASDRAFDSNKWRENARPDFTVPDGSLITLGFDGARYHDATAIVATHIESGYQWVVGLWECPLGVDRWETPEEEVETALADVMERYDVWRMYCDPPYWETHVAQWAGEYGSDRVMRWPTTRTAPMAAAIRSYDTSIKAGEVTHSGDRAFARHIGNAVRRVLTLRDDKGERLWTIYKERPDSPMKIDAAMAGALSWEARRDAIAAGVTSQQADMSVMVMSW